MNNKRFSKLKGLMFGAVATILASNFQTSTQALTFSDTAGHNSEAAIDRWSDYGVIVGSQGYFRPDGSLTRGEMAVVLNKVMDYQIKASNIFFDLDLGAFYTDPILKLNSAGFMDGYNFLVRPNDYITREEAAVILANAFHLDVPATTANPTPTTYTDDYKIGYWSKNAVNILRPYMLGRSDGSFEPTVDITRAELIDVLDALVGEFVQDNKVLSNITTKSMVINEAGVTLKNSTISGDLIIAEGVADGDIYLENVTVGGNIIIKGGSVATIFVDDVYVSGRLEVSRVDKPTLVTILGKSIIPQVDIFHNCVVDATGLDIGNSVGNVNIYGEDDVTLRGPFDKVTNYAPNANITVSGNIDQFYMNTAGTVNGTYYPAGSNLDTSTFPGTSASGAPDIYITSKFPNDYSSAFISVSDPSFNSETGEVELFVYVSSLENCVLMADAENAITVPDGSNLKIEVVEKTEGTNTFDTYVYKVNFTLTSSTPYVELEVNFKTNDGVPDIGVVKNFDAVTDENNASASVRITDTLVVVDEETGEEDVIITLIVSHMEGCRLPSNSAKAVTLQDGKDADDYPSFSVVRGTGSDSTLTTYQISYTTSETVETLPLQVNFIDSDGSDYANVEVVVDQNYDLGTWKDSSGNTISPSADVTSNIDVLHYEDEEHNAYVFEFSVYNMENCKLHPVLAEILVLQDEDSEVEFEYTVHDRLDGKIKDIYVTVPYDEKIEDLKFNLNLVDMNFVEDGTYTVTSNIDSDTIEDPVINVDHDISSLDNEFKLFIDVLTEVDGYSLLTDLTKVITVTNPSSVVDGKITVTKELFDVTGQTRYKVLYTPSGTEIVNLQVNYDTHDASDHSQTIKTTTSIYVDGVSSLADVDAIVDDDVDLYEDGTTSVLLTISDIDSAYQLADLADKAKLITPTVGQIVTDTYSVEEKTTGERADGTHYYEVKYKAADKIDHVDLVVHFERISGTDSNANLSQGGSNTDDFNVSVGGVGVGTDEEDVVVGTTVRVDVDLDKGTPSIVVKGDDGNALDPQPILSEQKTDSNGNVYYTFPMPDVNCSVEVTYKSADFDFSYDNSGLNTIDKTGIYMKLDGVKIEPHFKMDMNSQVEFFATDPENRAVRYINVQHGESGSTVTTKVSPEGDEGRMIYTPREGYKAGWITAIYYQDNVNNGLVLSSITSVIHANGSYNSTAPTFDFDNKVIVFGIGNSNQYDALNSSALDAVTVAHAYSPSGFVMNLDAAEFDKSTYTVTVPFTSEATSIKDLVGSLTFKIYLVDESTAEIVAGTTRWVSGTSAAKTLEHSDFLVTPRLGGDYTHEVSLTIDRSALPADALIQASPKVTITGDPTNVKISSTDSVYTTNADTLVFYVDLEDAARTISFDVVYGYGLDVNAVTTGTGENQGATGTYAVRKYDSSYTADVKTATTDPLFFEVGDQIYLRATPDSTVFGKVLSQVDGVTDSKAYGNASQDGSNNRFLYTNIVMPANSYKLNVQFVADYGTEIDVLVDARTDVNDDKTSLGSGGKATIKENKLTGKYLVEYAPATIPGYALNINPLYAYDFEKNTVTLLPDGDGTYSFTVSTPSDVDQLSFVVKYEKIVYLTLAANPPIGVANNQIHVDFYDENGQNLDSELITPNSTIYVTVTNEVADNPYFEIYSYEKGISIKKPNADDLSKPISIAKDNFTAATGNAVGDTFTFTFNIQDESVTVFFESRPTV